MEETTDLLELVRNSSLLAINTHELTAVSALSGEVSAQEDSRVKYELETRVDDKTFGLRVTARLNHSKGQMRVTIAADYKNAGPPPSEEVLAEFGPQVGFMTIYPYLRQAVSYLSSTVLGEHMLLAMIRREDLLLSQEPPAEQG